MGVDGCETNILSYVTNCGGCGVVCPAGANSTPYCSGGNCGIVCSAGFANCDNTNGNGCEVNLQNDSNNCGGCGVVCVPGHVCSGGVCV